MNDIETFQRPDDTVTTNDSGEEESETPESAEPINYEPDLDFLWEAISHIPPDQRVNINPLDFLGQMLAIQEKDLPAIVQELIIAISLLEAALPTLQAIKDEYRKQIDAIHRQENYQLAQAFSLLTNAKVRELMALSVAPLATDQLPRPNLPPKKKK